ncbi:MAG TPA: pilus assembly protein PilM [Tepidisphaeraceae bacterium]|jgi:type IV pilus assembly protein PilM|nr:pilus assembly protein PilM [Tepidisphaeraceae bacterium]
MFRLTRAQVQPVGVDLGTDSIKMLQLEIVDGSLSVVAAARAPMPDEVRAAPLEDRMSVAAGLVKGLLRQNPFVGRNVVLALPREMVHVKNLRMAPLPDTELPAAIRAEATNLFPIDIDIDSAQVRHLLAGEVRQGGEARQEVIVLAARNDDVDGFVERFHSSGAVIQSLDVEPCAAYRSVERFIRRQDDEQDVNVLIDIGARQTLVVIGRGRSVSFVKSIDIGGDHLNDVVAKKLGLDPAESRTLRRRLGDTGGATGAQDPVRQAVHDVERSVIEDLIREVGLCLRYYSVTFRGSRPTRVRLTGGEAADPSVQALMNAALPMPVEAARPLHSVNISRMKASDRRGSLAEWSVALGLSLKATTRHFGPRDGKPRTVPAPMAALSPSAAPANAASQAALATVEQAMAAAPTITATPLTRGVTHA